VKLEIGELSSLYFRTCRQPGESELIMTCYVIPVAETIDELVLDQLSFRIGVLASRIFDAE